MFRFSPPAGRPQSDPASHSWTVPTSTSLALSSLTCTQSAMANGHRAQHVATCPPHPTVLPPPVQTAWQRNAGSRTRSQTQDVCAAGVALETSGDGVAKGAMICSDLQRRSTGSCPTASQQNHLVRLRSVETQRTLMPLKTPSWKRL